MSLGAFQKTCLIVAIVILLIILLVVASLLVANESKWPPETPECPDWWISDGSGAKAICKNNRKLGSCGDQKFNTNKYTGDQGLCNKYKWAHKCGVSWDGVTYGIPNPCDSDSD